MADSKLKLPNGGAGGRNSPTVGDNGLQVEPGDNSRFVGFSMTLAALPKINVKDSEAVNNRIQEFFTLCYQNDMKPTVAGMAIALDLDRRRLWEIKTGSYHTSAELANLPEASTDAIKKAYVFLENLWENYMQNGKINPMAGVFLGVNNYGYYDVKQINLVPQQESPLGKELTQAEIMEKTVGLPEYDGPDDFSAE